MPISAERRGCCLFLLSLRFLNWEVLSDVCPLSLLLQDWLTPSL